MTVKKEIVITMSGEDIQLLSDVAELARLRIEIGDTFFDLNRINQIKEFLSKVFGATA